MVDIIPKKQKKALPWQSITYGAGAFLAAVVLSYAALYYLSSKTSTVLDNFKTAIAKVGTPTEKAMEKNVLQYKRKISDFSDLSSKRMLSSGFFGNFEKLVHPKVWFKSFSLNVFKMELTASGQTVNFQTLDQQLAILRKDERISAVDLSSLAIGKGGEADFSLRLSLKKEIFQQ